MSKRWEFGEVVILTDYMIGRDAVPTGEELTALRDELFPDRTEHSVRQQAYDIQSALGRRIPGRQSKLHDAVLSLFKQFPGEMARHARLLRG